MTSDRKIAANRANAKKSTGPKTAVGKQRSRRNAFRHGLATPVTSQSGHEIERLANFLCQPGMVTEFARTIAETVFDLRRIREFRAMQFALIMGNTNPPLAACDRLTDDLRTLERYEQRAYSRRKRALKGLIRIAR